MESNIRNRLIIIVIAAITYRSTTNMLQTSVPLLANSLHYSNFVVSLIVSISTLSSIFSLFFFGFKSVSLRKGTILCLGVTCLSLPMFLVIQNEYLLAILYGFISFWTGSLGMLFVTSAVLIGDQRTRVRNIAIFTSMLSLSLLLGPIYQSGLLVATQNNLPISMVLFSPLVGSAAIAFSRLRFNDNSKVSGGFELGFIRNRNFWAGVLINESFTYPSILILTFGGIFSRRAFGTGYSEIEAFFGIFFFASFITRFFIVRQERLSRKKMTISAFVTIFIGLALLYFSSNLASFIASLTLLGYAHGVTYPIASAYISESTARNYLLRANSLFLLIDDLNSLIATPIIGFLSQLTEIRTSALAIEIPVLAMFLGFISLSKVSWIRRESIS